MKILIMGLPGSGKSTLAKKLLLKLGAVWYNADEVREQYNDWDFSMKGRIRQAHRMKQLADSSISESFRFVLCDFVAPTEYIRNVFDADFVIWLNTIPESRFKDTNSVFQTPEKYDYRIDDFNYNTQDIVYKILDYAK